MSNVISFGQIEETNQFYLPVWQDNACYLEHKALIIVIRSLDNRNTKLS